MREILQPPIRAWRGLALSIVLEHASDADEKPTNPVCAVFSALKRYGGSLPVPLLLHVLEHEEGCMLPGCEILAAIRDCPRVFSLHRVAKAA